MDTVFHDLRFALRTLGRSRAFAVAAVLTLGLGIGANTAIFSVVHGVLLRSLPFREPDRLMVVWMENRPSGIEKDVTSAPTFLDWKARGTVFESMAAFAPTYRNLTGTDEPERIRAALGSEGLFGVLGVRPALGRTFNPEEHQEGRNGVAVLSHGLWTRRFGADPGIIGRTVSLNAGPVTVVGVMPPGFRYPEDAEVWLPLAFAPDESRGSLWLSVVGRLRPGVTREQAQAHMSAVARDLAGEYPDQLEGIGILLEPLRDVLVGEVRPALLVLLGAVGFVLLIACANVANLLFARSAGRAKEFAVRAALGAARGRIARQVLTESVVLALLGGGLGLLLAYWGVGLLVAAAPPDLPRLDEIGVNRTVLLFALGVSALTGVLFGAVPALQISRPDLTGWLRDGGRGATGTAGGRLRRLLVVAEVALALVLLIGAGLMIRTLATLRAVDPGFQVERMLTFNVALPAARYPEPERAEIFFRELLEGIEAVPGVESAAAASTILLDRLPNQARMVLEGAPDPAPGEPVVEIPFDAVTHGFFETMGLELVAGRVLDERDRRDAPRVAVVNRALARRFFGEGDPLGKRFALGGRPQQDDRWITIVGVVEDTRRSGLVADPRPEAYFAHSQLTTPFMTVVVRGSRDPMTLVAPIRQVVKSIDPDQPLSEVGTLEQALSETVSTQRFSALLLTLFSVVAALLAAVGIYGLMAYSVGQRTREIGIRMALGAQRRDVVTAVTLQALGSVAPGVAVGLLGAFALTRLMGTLLYGVTATDPGTFLGVSVLLSVVAGVAAYVPARRAAKVDPVVALRSD